MSRRIVKVVIYVRVSTEDQAEKGYSLEAQIEDCQNKAFALGYQTEQIFVLTDDFSGATLERPGLRRLREMVEGLHKPELIIIYDPDRLARKLTHQLLLTEEIVKAGIRLEFVNFEWKNTPEGRMFYQLRGMFAEFEREKIRERTIRGRMTKIKNYGKLSGDPRLYGYRFDTEQDVLVVDPPSAEIVRLIFHMCANGESGENIARILARDGIPAPRGKTWYGSTVTRILHNRTYLGTFMAYKVDYHQGYKRTRPKEEQFPLPLESLIDEKLFAKAQEVLAKYRTSAGRPAKRTFLLSGLAYCFCGNVMTGGSLSGNKSYSYYSCSTKRQRGHQTLVQPAEVRSGSNTAESKSTDYLAERCPSRYWNAQLTDSLIWEKIYALLLSVPGEKLVTCLPQCRSIQQFDEQSPELNIFESRVVDMEAKREKLIDLYMTERIDGALYDQKSVKLEEELRTARRKLAELREERRQEASLRDQTLQQISMSVNPQDEWKDALESLEFQQKKEIVNLLVRQVVFEWDDRLRIELKVSEDFF